MKAAAWIDRVKSVRGWESDYRVAKETGIHANSISTYRNKGSTMDDEAAFKVARVLNIDPALVLADQAMERTKSEEARTAWHHILERLGGVAASFLLGTTLLGGIGASPDAQAASHSQNDSKQAGGNLYIV